MAPLPRSAGAYVHGNDGVVVVVPGRVAAWLERECDLRRRRTETRGRDAELDAVLVALAVAAAAWRDRVGSEFGTKRAPESVPVASLSSVISTDDAAAQCGFTSPRPIVRAIADGRLEASKIGGRWLIDVESFAHYLAARAA